MCRIMSPQLRSLIQKVLSFIYFSFWTERWLCIMAYGECRFTSLLSHADVEPNSKCYCVSPSVQVHRSPPHPPIHTPSILPCYPPRRSSTLPWAAASLLGPACLSLPKSSWLMRPWTHPVFPLDLGSPTAEKTGPAAVPQSWAWAGSTEGTPQLQVATHELCQSFVS